MKAASDTGRIYQLGPRSVFDARNWIDSTIKTECCWVRASCESEARNKVASVTRAVVGPRYGTSMRMSPWQDSAVTFCATDGRDPISVPQDIVLTQDGRSLAL